MYLKLSEVDVEYKIFLLDLWYNDDNKIVKIIIFVC